MVRIISSDIGRGLRHGGGVSMLAKGEGKGRNPRKEDERRATDAQREKFKFLRGPPGPVQ